jgi:hypothetical protein
VAFITFDTHARWACGKTVIRLLNGVGVTYSTLHDGTESGCVSIQSNVCFRCVIKSESDAELHVFIFPHDCTLILQAGTAS